MAEVPSSTMPSVGIVSPSLDQRAGLLGAAGIVLSETFRLVARPSVRAWLGPLGS